VARRTVHKVTPVEVVAGQLERVVNDDPHDLQAQRRSGRYAWHFGGKGQPNTPPKRG